MTRGLVKVLLNVPKTSVPAESSRPLLLCGSGATSNRTEFVMLKTSQLNFKLCASVKAHDLLRKWIAAHERQQGKHSNGDEAIYKHID
jgi:hypothetical protein